MKNILNGWTIPRILYTFIGIMVIANAIMEQQYWGIALGGYFAAMGIFNFGCAAGGCYTGNCNTAPVRQPKNNLSQIDFEEIKNK
jgi:hypothetical protein